MPKRKTTSLDKSRQALAKAIKGESKRLSKSAARLTKAASKKVQQVKRARDDEYIARWRILKNLGLIQSKKPPAKKRLNSKTKSKINKEFYALQGYGHYSNGKVVRPLKKVEYKTPKGNKKEKYELTQFFQVVKTKKKTSAKTGVIETAKGYIIERNSPETSIKINKKGELVEKTGKTIRRRSSYNGKYVIQLVEQIERGEFKIRRDEYLIYRPWGSEAYEQMYAADSLDDFARQVRNYQTQMNAHTFKGWLDTSEIMFIKE